MLDAELFERDPRKYALNLVDDHLVGCEAMLAQAIDWLSHRAVREMLEANEWSPEFDPDWVDEGEDEDEDEDDA